MDLRGAILQLKNNKTLRKNLEVVEKKNFPGIGIGGYREKTFGSILQNPLILCTVHP